MAEFRPQWFQVCTDPTHPRGPHVHVSSGAIQVTDERIANAAEDLAFPETDAGLLRCESVHVPIGHVHSETCRGDAFRARVAALLKSIMEMARDEDVEATRQRLFQLQVQFAKVADECGLEVHLPAGAVPQPEQGE